MIVQLLLLLPVAPPPIVGNYHPLGAGGPHVCWQCPEMFPLEFAFAFMGAIVLLMGAPAVLGDYFERRRRRSA
jgi:hypothetical protein